MTLQDRITEALSVLIGQPLWGATRALNMEMFDIGEQCTWQGRKGQVVEGGKYSLHIQCSWRIVGPDGIVVGSEDRRYPEDENSNWEEFDPDGPTRCEARIMAWLREHSAAPLKIQRLEVDPVGGFKLFLQGDFILEAFPANSLQGEYSERWRLFCPSEKRRHFVVCGYGVED